MGPGHSPLTAGRCVDPAAARLPHRLGDAQRRDLVHVSVGEEEDGGRAVQDPAAGAGALDFRDHGGAFRTQRGHEIPDRWRTRDIHLGNFFSGDLRALRGVARDEQRGNDLLPGVRTRVHAAGGNHRDRQQCRRAEKVKTCAGGASAQMCALHS